MDPNALGGMIFTLLLTLLIGGFIVLFPITRRLGQALEVWISEHRKPGQLPAETSTLLTRLDDLTIRLSEVEEQNAFLERLVRKDAQAIGEHANRPLVTRGGAPVDDQGISER